MYEVVTKLEGGKVVILMQKGGKLIEDFRKEFPIEAKKEWQSWHKLALREANSRNEKERRKAPKE
jgi:predicted transposase YbfD/YdcC